MVLEIVLGVAVLGVVVVVAWFLLTYNSFIQLKNRIDNAWSQIDVQMKKRFDLVPNLVETVKGYAKHEKSTFEEITKARAQMAGAQGVKATAEASDFLTGALKSLFAVAESYPELKANQNFLMLQEELAGIESKIAFARQFYNDTVLGFNTKLESIPDRFVGSLIGLSKRDYFELEAAAREPVKVSF